VALAGAGVALLLLALALLALAVRAGRWALAQGRLLHRRRAWHRARALWQNQLARSPLPQDAPVLAQALADHVRHHHLAPPADWWAELDTWRFAPTTLQSPASAHETLDRLARQLPAPLPPEPPA
jgi:hypothetical protein